MAKIMRQTLREQVTQAIRMKLLTGQLKPGTRIVEQEMAEELGVSRGPVREALRQIEQEGLVEYASHVGCFVKDFNAQDVYEVYLLRANLEILSVKMCDGKFSPQTIEHKRSLALRHHIAMWDTLAACDIRGASDTSIRNPVANDLPWLIAQTQVRAVFCTGATSYKYYKKLC